MWKFYSGQSHLFFVLVIAIIWLSRFPAPVLADAAPPSPPVGSNPLQDNPTTRVQMVSETVIFDVAASSPNKYGQARVTATFQMHNQGDQDEKMLVRFPLRATNYDVTCDIESHYPYIHDLAARVDDTSVATTTSAMTITESTDPLKQVTYPCWANFPVTFPSGKDVMLQVTYTALGSGRPGGKFEGESHTFAGPDSSGEISFLYVLQTGAGWYFPIGKADVILRFPYPVNDKNVDFGWIDPTWQALGNELTWHKDKFEPEENLTVDLTNPVIWQTILIETKNTQANPKDGEAWGRLGKAYKQAIWMNRGVRQDPGGVAMAQLSDQAYQHALNLLPNDADWHYGYAELLCWQAEWAHIGDTTISSSPDWIPCVQQLKRVKELNPNDPRANIVLQDIARASGGGAVDMSGAHPDYLILTPLPILTLENTLTITPSHSGATPTAIPQNTPAVQTSGPTSHPTPEVTLNPTVSTPLSTRSIGFPRFWVIGLAAVAVVIAIAYWKSRRI
jgi:hypothetical protein